MPMRATTAALLSLALAVLGLALAGCKNECEENLHCDIDQICSPDGDCIARACAASTSCPMQQFCNDDTGVCETGCTSDRDCYPGDQCHEDGHCVDPGCRSTALDCQMGQFCNPLTGECFDATGAYCKECDGDEECGAGNICLLIGGYPQTYCGVDCSGGQECPRGYTCGAVQDPTGNIVGYQCITACWLLEEL